MPYTNPWTDLHPAGTDFADDIEQYIQRVRTDIHERMDDVVVDWTADPVVPLATGSFGSSKHYKYDGDLAPGAKATDPVTIKAMLALEIIVTLNSNSEFQIALGEADETWLVADLVDWDFRGYIAATNDHVFARLVSSDSLANTLTFQVAKSDGGDVDGLVMSQALLVLYFKELPS